MISDYGASADQQHISLTTFNNGKSVENTGSFLNYKDTEEVVFAHGGHKYVIVAPTFETVYGAEATENQVWVSLQSAFEEKGMDLSTYTEGELLQMQYPPPDHVAAIIGERSGAAL